MNSINALKHYQYNLTYLSLFLVGGGASFIYEYIKESIPNIIKVVSDSQFLNAIAYQKIGEMQFGKKKN